MSRLSRFLREHEPGAWLSFLLFINKACNTALMLIGVAMLVYAGDIYATQRGSPPPPLWPPTRPPAASLVFTGMALLAAVSAAAGLGAASQHSLLLLNTHLGLLALLLAGEVCMAAAVAAYDEDGDPTVVPDIQGGIQGGGGVQLAGVASSVRRDVRQALVSYKWADAAALAVEVLTLVFGCMLHSAYMRADERAEDLEEGLVADSTAPLLTHSRRHELRQGAAAAGGRTPLPPRVVRDDPWSRRMRDQYGLDTSILSYDPQAQSAAGGGPQAAAAAPSRPSGAQAASSSRCTIS